MAAPKRWVARTSELRGRVQLARSLESVSDDFVMNDNIGIILVPIGWNRRLYESNGDDEDDEKVERKKKGLKPIQKTYPVNPDVPLKARTANNKSRKKKMDIRGLTVQEKLTKRCGYIQNFEEYGMAHPRGLCQRCLRMLRKCRVPRPEAAFLLRLRKLEGCCAWCMQTNRGM